MLPQEALSQAQAADRLDVSRRQLRRLTRNGIVDRSQDGSYPWPRIEAEHEAFLEESEKKRGSGDETLLLARTRKMAAEASLTELELERRQGQWIHIDDVTGLLEKSLRPVSVILRGAPTSYGPELAQRAGIPLAEAMAILGDLSEKVKADLRDAPGTGEA